MVDFPMQFAGAGLNPRPGPAPAGNFDMRRGLHPRRLTMVMWDESIPTRHGPGGSFQDFDRVLDEAMERGYNTIRVNPMPQWIDLAKPETVFAWPDPQLPYMPWGRNTAVNGPLGAWLIEFMEKLLKRNLGYTLTTGWSDADDRRPGPRRIPQTPAEAAEIWLGLLTEWKRRFGFAGLVYVDINNEIPYFLPGFLASFEQETGGGWETNSAFSPAQIRFLERELNGALAALQREFPELRFTASIHGDPRWLEVPLDFDCLDVHFYADADPRWRIRTRFGDFMGRLFTDAAWHKEFSDRCGHTRNAIAPMLRARQRQKIAAFAAWGQQRGLPLTTTEAWASWYYMDSPDLDWAWLLEWAEWSVEDAIEFKLWGWTPHNYCQPQFKNWRDVRWHQRLTGKFLKK